MYIYLTGWVVKRRQKIREIPMPTWIIQHVEAIAMHDGHFLSEDNKPLLNDRFAHKNDFATALHEGGITVVAQDNDKQDNDNDNDNINTNEYPNDPPGIGLDTAVAPGKISGVFPQKPTGTPRNGPTRKPGGTPRSGLARKRGR